MNAFEKKAGFLSGSVMAVPAATNGVKSKIPWKTGVRVQFSSEPLESANWDIHDYASAARLNAPPWTPPRLCVEDGTLTPVSM